MENEGWIEWNGGECPVAPRCRVDTLHRNGYEVFGNSAGEAHVGRWGRGFFKHRHDIIAYRIAEPLS